ncbi:MAG: exo-beta-N-acetylmuramidase NamZ domain-containing protein [Tenacibaculum sp.]
MVLKAVKNKYLFWVFILCFILVLLGISVSETKIAIQDNALDIKTGADRVELYIDKLKNKNIALVANQSSIINFADKKRLGSNQKLHQHLVDFLYNYKNIFVKKVFAPEHGFRGKADAGETVKDRVDALTGIPIISLYGRNKKPLPKQLRGIDILVFDIQDVGVRFYTYISTLHYVMEACAELGIKVLILDRPNPNAHYIDGPILEPKHQSFVGMHPVPVVYGMTIGEYAKMINGQKWLKNGIQCNLTVIPILNYQHKAQYPLPVKPSPNLPNAVSVNLYPSLGFFEGTHISVGRGTDKPFQIVGSPFYKLKKYNYYFTPLPNNGAKNPKHNGKTCYGYNLSYEPSLKQLELKWLVDFYQTYTEHHPKEKPFFNSFFTKLAGTENLQQQIEKGFTISQIRASWKKDLGIFKEIRKKYLLYK